LGFDLYLDRKIETIWWGKGNIVCFGKHPKMGMSHEIRIFHSLKCFTIDVVMPPPPSCSIILPTISVIKGKIL